MSHFTSPSSSTSMSYPIHLELASFKKGIKREASAYSILKEYFDKFQREIFITVKSHNASEILDPTFTPGPSQEEKELFEAKQTFMYKVFKKTLLTNVGRYKVRMYLRTTDAKAVWKEYSENMTTVSKGASEKRKLTQYVTITVLPHAIRPWTLKNTNQRFVPAGGEEDHQPHPKPMEHPTPLQIMVNQLCQIKGLLQLEGRKIISLAPKP